CFRLDRPQEGWEVLRALLPEYHPTREYRAEPYVIAADVAWAPGRKGRGAGPGIPGRRAGTIRPRWGSCLACVCRRAA
ncbi:MAG: hypothetical protein AAGU02_09525, partial [Lawsonibacter sp.]